METMGIILTEKNIDAIFNAIDAGASIIEELAAVDNVTEIVLYETVLVTDDWKIRYRTKRNIFRNLESKTTAEIKSLVKIIESKSVMTSLDKLHLDVAREILEADKRAANIPATAIRVK